MRLTNLLMLGAGLLLAQPALAHGPIPAPLQRVPIPPVPGLVDGADPIVVDKNAAVALGKALFWDTSIGSDGMACASCHFHAGVDRRVKNQINPGQKSSDPSGQTFSALPSGAGAGGPNYSLKVGDFPTYQFSNPLSKTSAVVYSTDDSIASAGTFTGNFTGAAKFNSTADDCNRGADPVFHVGSVGTRRVEPRNTPTVINAVFNYRNFWDGRANNIYNGSSPWGDRDPNAGVWVKINARTAQKQRLHLINSSLASQAMGPPLSDAEMSCRQRIWPDIGRKLLLRQPLQNQKVHNEDSVLGVYSLSTAGNLKPGLNTTYKNLITQAFSQKYWSFSGLGPFGAPSGQPPYNQMEANFSMFFGLALQLYQSTLVSDQSPFDLSPRNPVTYSPTWAGMGKTAEEIASLTNGFAQFNGNHCNLCHAGPAITLAAIATNATLVTSTPGATYGPVDYPRAYGPDALGPTGTNAASAAGITPYPNVITRDQVVSGMLKLNDFGFAVTGVNDPVSDPGVGGVDDFGHPLSFSAQYVQYLLDNPAGVYDPGVNQVRTCDFLYPLAYNITDALTQIYTVPDGIIPDGSKEGAPRNQNCRTATDFFGLDAYIPTAAAVSLADPNKIGTAIQASFKIPGLRNVELTGPYMHNGSMATLDQVVEFYARRGNVNNGDIGNPFDSISLAGLPAQSRADLVTFLKSLTDDRVRYERAPFDHPEIAVLDAHPGDNASVTAGNPLNSALATDGLLTIPAVGANGSASPLLPFDAYLAP